MREKWVKYREIIIQRSRTLWQRFPEAALLNLLHFLCQGSFLLLYSVEKDMNMDQMLWTERLMTLMLVAVAAELWREGRDWQPGRYRWKIWAMLAAWAVVFEGCAYYLPDSERFMFYLASPGFWFCIIVYLMLPRDKERQSQQLRYIANSLTSAAVIGLLLSLLLGVCLAAVEALLVDFPVEIKILLLGLLPLTCAINVCLCLLPAVKEIPLEAEPALAGIVMKLVFPCCMFLLLVLYLYIGKIILQQTMPIGAMNWYASLALLGYGFFYFFWNDIQRNWFGKFMKWGLLVFIPILVVQFYGVWIRYEAYGLTTLRYLSMICTAYGILLLVCRFLGRGIRPLWLVAAALVAVFTLSPLNVMRVPLHNQQARLISLLEKEGLYADGKIAMSHQVSAENASAVKGSVDYIRRYGDMDPDSFSYQVKQIKWKDYLPKDVTSKKTSGMELPPKHPEDHIRFFPSRKGIPVAGYQWAYAVNIKKAVVVIPLEDGERRQVDLTDYVTRLVAEQKDVPWQEGKFKNRREKKVILNEGYVLDDHSLLYFTELEVVLDEYGKMQRVNGRGYLLLK